jgi:arginase
VSVAPFSVLADRYGDDLAIVWIDSHPDVGTGDSGSPGYHAMAVSTLTGYGDPDVQAVLPATVSADRVALVGLHSWTDDDYPHLAEWGLHSFIPEELRGCNEIVLGLGAEPNGLTSAEVRRVGDIEQAVDVVGFTIAEFFPRRVMHLRQIVRDSRSSTTPPLMRMML